MTWQLLAFAGTVACATFLSAAGLLLLRQTNRPGHYVQEIEDRAFAFLHWALLTWLGALLVAPFAFGAGS